MGTPIHKTQRQRLGEELRRLRDLSGLTGRQVAEAVGVNQSTVSRIESGRTVPTLPQAEAWLDAVRTAPERRQAVLDLVEPAMTEVETWQAKFSGGVPTLQDQTQQLEAGAALIRNYQPTLVPGLLQTADYARQVFSHGTIPWQDVGAAVTARLERQQLLYEPGRTFEFILTEAGLHWNPGPGAKLRSQLDRVASLATLDSVRVGVIPLGAETPVIPAHPYVLFENLTDGAPAFCQVEVLHAVITVFDPADLLQYTEHYEKTARAALWEDDALAAIRRIAGQL